MLKKIKNKFNPLLFLSSLGAGGIAVSGFILIQYGGLFEGKGLAILAEVPQTPLVLALEAIMIVFGFIHLVLTIMFLAGHFNWKKTKAYKEYKENPLVNSGLITPLLSLAMSMNVVIAVVRYFSDAMSSNFQTMMAPAFIVFVILWIATVLTSISLLKKSFTNSFDVDKIHFGWLLQPFALTMVSVTGAGFAALAKNTAAIGYNADIAGMAAFLVLISGGMAVFLTLVKMFSIFKKHLHRDGALEDQFMPTYLIVIPILTLLGITVFRLGHYAEHIFHEPLLFVFAKIIMLGLYAFQLWYFVFGLFMLKGYWNGYLAKKFHVSQWGLICPFVALTALSGFVFHAFFANQIFLVLILVLFAFTIGLFFYLLKRQFSCINSEGEGNLCD